MGTEHPPSAIDADDISKALERVVESASFRDSPQLKTFLRYVVQETLAGRGGELKGYTIAVSALGRPPSFDPQTDPIVRVQAGRLRQALQEYNTSATDPGVEIALEKGSYSPVFRYRPQLPQDGRQVDPALARSGTSAVPQPTLPRQSAAVLKAPATAAVASAPVLSASRNLWLALCGALLLAGTGVAFYRLVPSAQESTATAPSRPMSIDAFFPSLAVEQDAASDVVLTSSIAFRTRDAIARFDDLIVVQEEVEMAAALSGARPDKAATSYSLRIGANAEGARQMRISARLIEKERNVLVWSQEYGPFPGGPEGDESRTAAIRSIASSVAQPYGIIHAHVRERLTNPDRRADPYGCIVAGLDYWLVNTREAHLAARNCILDRLKLIPNFGPLHAQLAYLHLEEFRHGYNALPDDPRSRALASAQKAVQFRPASARSHQALMAANFAIGNVEGAWQAAGDALQLNPGDAEIVADVGSYHVLAGNYHRGLEYLQSAIAMQTAPPAWVTAFRILALYMTGQLDRSSPMAQGMDGSKYPIAMIASVMAAAQMSHVENSRRHLIAFRKEHPAIAADLRGFLKKLQFNDRDTPRLLEDYGRAVAWIERQP